MKKLFYLVFLIILTNTTKAQIGIGTQTPNASAALEIKDSTRGILIPRMTMVRRIAITSPAEGLMVYQTDSTKGYWYFDGILWRGIDNLNNSSTNYGGKSILILSDTITNAGAQLKIATEFGPNTQEIRIFGCLNLTTVDLSMATKLVSITVTDNPSLNSINLNNLSVCAGGGVNVSNCPQLTSLNLHSLKYLGGTSDGIGIFNTNLSSLVLDSLQRLYGYFGIMDNSNLTYVSFPKLSFWDLSSTTGSYITNNPLLSSINLNSLQTIRGKNYINFNSNKLPSTQINYLLNKFAIITPVFTGYGFDFSGQSPAAPPTGQGIIDKNILITNGNTVNTD